MDDLAHESLPFDTLTRKRKADQDDCPPKDPPSNSDAPNVCDQMRIDSSATPRCPAKPTEHTPAPSWLLPTAKSAMAPSWPQQSPIPESSSSFGPDSQKDSPSRPKRPRIEIPQTSPTASPRRLRRGRGLYSHTVPSPRRYARRARLTTDIRDTGVISAADPGPSRGSLLRVSTFPSTPRPSSSSPVSPVETLSLHIPPHQPPINRDTLKELDLEAILRNPQLRHDLLFDSGLQFRPTSSRRKRDLADNYWLAIVRELESGCTCFTVDSHGRPCEGVCICKSLPMPTARVAFASNGRTTIRVASRVRSLLLELLEVLVSIIQPVLHKSTGLCVQPTALHPQFQQNIAHVATLRSVLDADLIQQEIAHGLFDPSGVFQTIGDIIRCHCAPMRDNAVDQMVTLAKSCAPGGTGTKLDAVRAIRLCFEIMELMKLDVANHQLQTLRPYLIQSAAQYELRTFEESQKKGHLSLDITREWLQAAVCELTKQHAESTALRSVATAHPNTPFAKLPRWTQIQIAVTSAIVESVFNPPSASSSPSGLASPAAFSPIPHPFSPRSLANPTSAPGYPETLYLDHARLATLAADAADFTTVYMLLMVYRQLVFSGTASAQPRAQVKLEDLLRLKKEIWEIGPAHLGLCFQASKCRLLAPSASDKVDSRTEAEWARWRDEVNDVVLQITMRATEARQGHPAASAPVSAFASAPSEHTARSTHPPDPQLLKLASSWAASNLRHDAPLSTLMRRRIRDQVLEAAVQIVVPTPAAHASTSTSTSMNSGANAGSHSHHPLHTHAHAHARGGGQEDAGDAGTTSGLEPLAPEMQHLAERVAKLASIHLNVYGALYTQPGFLPGWGEAQGTACVPVSAAAHQP